MVLGPPSPPRLIHEHAGSSPLCAFTPANCEPMNGVSGLLLGRYLLFPGSLLSRRPIPRSLGGQTRVINRQTRWMIYASACIRSSAQSHNSLSRQEQGGRCFLLRGAARRRGKAASLLVVSFKSFERFPPAFDKRSPAPNPTAASLCRRPFLVLVPWLWVRVRVRDKRGIKAFCVHFLFVFIPTGKTGGKGRRRGHSPYPRPGTCPTSRWRK